MADILINLNKSCGIQARDIKNLLEQLKPLNSITREDSVVVKLPEPNQISDLGLVLIWTKLRELTDFPCKKILKYSKGSTEYFDERHFFDRLVLDNTSSFFSKKVPFHFNSFNLKENEDETANKIALVSKASIENMPLGSETKVHILELVSNAFHHSQATIDVGCISKFNFNNGIFEFYIADQGKGIRNSFSRNEAIWPEYSSYSEAEIIEKAADQYVTCNPKNARQYEHKNSGIGLYFLREFCLHHGGHVVIISGRGYYYIDKVRVKKKLLTTPWQGTIVAFRSDLKRVSQDYTAIKDKFMDEFEDRFTFKTT